MLADKFQKVTKCYGQLHVKNMSRPHSGCDSNVPAGSMSKAHYGYISDVPRMLLVKTLQAPHTSAFNVLKM
jgi:hypothetical protein